MPDTEAVGDRVHRNGVVMRVLWQWKPQTRHAIADSITIVAVERTVIVSFLTQVRGIHAFLTGQQRIAPCTQSLVATVT